MSKTKESYQVSASDLRGLIFRLNGVLGRIADRLDKLEGLRGELETKSGTFDGRVASTSLSVSVDDTKLHSME